MNINMTGFRWFPKVFAFFMRGTKVASELDGLTQMHVTCLKMLFTIHTQRRASIFSRYELDIPGKVV